MRQDLEAGRGFGFLDPHGRAAAKNSSARSDRPEPPPLMSLETPTQPLEGDPDRVGGPSLGHGSQKPPRLSGQFEGWGLIKHLQEARYPGGRVVLSALPGSGTPVTNGGGNGLGDLDTSMEELPDLAGMLRKHAHGGGSGGPGGGDGSWGDSSSGESPSEPTVDAVVGGYTPPGADESGWGTLVHPKALVVRAQDLRGVKRVAALMRTLQLVRRIP